MGAAGVGVGVGVGVVGSDLQTTDVEFSSTQVNWLHCNQSTPRHRSAFVGRLPCKPAQTSTKVKAVAMATCVTIGTYVAK